MQSIQMVNGYSGVYVYDGWQNSYLFSRDLLTCHDLADCEYPLAKSMIHIEYFLQQIEPAATRYNTWLEIYLYSQPIENKSFNLTPQQLLREVALVIMQGNVRLFKISDGQSSAVLS